MTSTKTVAETKAHLSECLRAIEHGDTIVITRHGRRVAALVAPDDLDAIERLRAVGPSAGLAGLARGWQDSEELVNHLERHRRGEIRETREPE